MVHVRLTEEEAEALAEGEEIEVVSANLGAPGHNGHVTLVVDEENATSETVGATSVHVGGK